MICLNCNVDKNKHEFYTYKTGGKIHIQNRCKKCIEYIKNTTTVKECNICKINLTINRQSIS